VNRAVTDHPTCDLSPLVLVTGASGRIGLHVVEELVRCGFRVRAQTTKPPADLPAAAAATEWVRFDLMSPEVDSLVEGCDAVLHLAATLWDIRKMKQLNVEATRLLAESAIRHNLRFFGFASSITVYGSARHSPVDEASPLMTGMTDIKNEYRNNPSGRAYARSKVLAEEALKSAALCLECVIFRPTLVVDLPVMTTVASRGRLKQFLLGNRHEHHIYVKDVAHAMVWFLKRALDRAAPAPGVEVFNLADDDAATVTGTAIAVRARYLTGQPHYRAVVAAPRWFYNLFEMLTQKQLSRRYPFGLTRYSAKKLAATGYRLPYGLDEAQRLAFTYEN
jgi:nucleoside-diphosphate-sugar epimerase